MSLPSQIKSADEILISAFEHHANIVPWQMLAERTGARLKVIPLTAEQQLDMDAYQQLLNSKTKLVSIAHISNALGVINPLKQIVEFAHQAGAQVIIDGAQAVAHEIVECSGT